MVKGISKRVVVVRFPDTRVFEQAILLMRDGHDEVGVTEQQILQEAGDIAAQYQHDRAGGKRRVWLPRILFALGGALLAAVVQLILYNI